MAAEPWVLRNLRGTRADPPGLAADDDYRRALYGAGLEQFEQLLHAAEVVDAAARPLPLFYALSQAGRAIVAARGDDPDIANHGLAEDRKHTPDDLLRRRIKRIPSNKDAFGAVAKATNSPELTGGVELGAVWAVLPQTYRLPIGSWEPDWRLDLSLLPQSGQPTAGMVRFQVWSMMGNPHVDVAQALSDRYPTLPSDTTYSVKAEPGTMGNPGDWAAVVEWSDQHDLDTIAPTVRGESGSRALIPTLPGQSELLSPLMTWWLLLFGLSIFARYHPGLWMNALRVDSSPTAVPVEAVLDRALDLLPRLVYDEVMV